MHTTQTKLGIKVNGILLQNVQLRYNAARGVDVLMEDEVFGSFPLDDGMTIEISIHKDGWCVVSLERLIHILVIHMRVLNPDI